MISGGKSPERGNLRRRAKLRRSEAGRVTVTGKNLEGRPYRDRTGNQHRSVG